MGTCFAFISASLTALFGTYNGYIDGLIWIYLFLSSWLIITTFALTVSFCQVTFGHPYPIHHPPPAPLTLTPSPPRPPHPYPILPPPPSPAL